MTIIGSFDKLSWLLPVYIAVAVLIVIFTALSVLGSVRVAKTAPQIDAP
jgi:hypothetical protein